MKNKTRYLFKLAAVSAVTIVGTQAAFPTNITNIVADATTFHATVLTFSVLAVAAAVAFRVIRGALKTR